MVNPKKHQKSVPIVNSSWVRHKLVRPRGRRLRVLIYARYSTDEQNPRSIDDQVRYCRQFLQSLGLSDDDVEIQIHYDEAVSGEVIFRDGIDAVRQKIKLGRVDVILGEDAGRFFRIASACIEFVESAVDQGIRVFCINDDVDTADEEYWEDRLYEAARHHERSNRFTSRRIERALRGLWANGFAIGLPRPGYLRKPVNHPADGESVEGPFIDEIDPAWAAIIEEVFTRIAAGDSTDDVADWLTAIKLPKSANSKKAAWSPRNVIALVRRTDYRGFQTFRNTYRQKKKRTGARRTKRSESSQIWTREMPHLRIVSDWLWHAANKAISDRIRGKRQPGGDDHPLTNIPRNSRGPYSKVFVCGICGGKMHLGVREEGGYRCAHVNDKASPCWNMATCLRKFTDQTIADAVIDLLRESGAAIDRLIAQCTVLLGDGVERKSRRETLNAEISELEQTIKALNDALERIDDAPASTVERLKQREQELAERKWELEGLCIEGESLKAPSRNEIEERILYFVGRLTNIDRHACDDMHALTGTIRAVPHRQFGSDKIVLRAKFIVRLGALLPARTRAAFASLYDDPNWEHFEQIPLVINLFKPSTGPEHGINAYALTLQGVRHKDVMNSLKLSKRKTSIAIDFGADLASVGLSDPFIELTEKPSTASRWRPRRVPAGDDAA